MIAASATESVTAVSTLYASVPFGQVPPNGFHYVSNWFGRGSLVDGTNFTHRLTTRAETFPRGAVMEWAFPSSGGSGLGAFAYGYPLINYGGGYYGNPYNVVGPWPMKIADLTALTVTYDVTLGGNTANHVDMLFDLFVTESSTSDDGSYVAEVSVFPYITTALLTTLTLTNTTVTTMSFGEVKVGRMGTQLCCFPTSSSGTVARSMLAGTINLKEIMDYMVSVSLGGLTNQAYIRGVQFGPEVQVPSATNSGPYAGWVRFNALSYVWT